MDAKAPGKVSPGAGGGKSRVPTVAAAHAFHPEATVPLVGIFLPTSDALWLYGLTSKVTRDCLVDCLGRRWEVWGNRFAPIPPVVINLDKGPEHSSRRPQCMRRIVDFAPRTGWTVCGADSPPSHRKYHPSERCWGILENHWNGALLDSIEAVIRLATTMPWQGKWPVVALVTPTYQRGVKLTKDAMQMAEAQLQRLPGLDKWLVDSIHHAG